ncbi:hypothetical protein FB567DRAFT_605627 [Paraphoma chrysanthemicola]|uniref:FAD/NAD(P)-binding domain-containing protein n=1 Tax=Paraphoma chrysanthemicola TaxID=798071 RepID=A0A8K0R3N2_9PLEO|nr:hypothetical protein FB567DRAFT_605627 [Paraphoma chrysanthemicola]
MPATYAEEGLEPPKAASGPQRVKSFASGTLRDGEYGSLMGFTQNQTEGSFFGPLAAVPEARRKRVIIVGGGINGIQQASTLLRDGCIGTKDMQIFDALDGYGGVWQKNKYPGYWTHFYAQRAEIQAYYARFATSYGLEGCTQFRSLVRACSWDEDLMIWHVAVANQDSGKIEHWTADVVCQCVGTLDRPKWGTTPGRENYRGVSWHTAHWQSYDLSGKRVAVIGCGPSAAQIIPEIVDKTKHLTVYMRTPPVCVPRGDFAYSSFYRWAFKYVPLFAWLVRARLNLRMMILGRKMATEGDPVNDQMTQLATTFMESQIQDPGLREILRPDSKYYCKRPLHLDNFYPALAKPNCTVVREDLVRYTERGVVSSDRSTAKKIEREFDVIIFGTGFNVAQYLEHEQIRGINGLDLQEKWKAHPEALYGLATSQFPNMFYCFGPNSAQVWSSQQDTWERQAKFATKAVREVLLRERKGIKFAMHPKRSVELKYNEEVQKKQAGKYVWANSNCVTYYKNDDGWNTFTMPWTWWQFRRMLRRIIWDEWEVIEKPLEKTVVGC